VVRTLDQRFGRLLIDAGNRYKKRGGQHKDSSRVLAETNFGRDLNALVGEPASSLPADAQQRILEAGTVTARQELLWIRSAALSAQRLGIARFRSRSPSSLRIGP
jgi:hypothetical protein